MSGDGGGDHPLAAYMAGVDAGRPSREDLRLLRLFLQRSNVETFVRRRVFDQHTAEDITSEVYLVVCRRRDEIPTEMPRAMGWLFQVARNLARNHIRGEGRRRRLVERATSHFETHLRMVHQQRQSPAIDRITATEAWGKLSSTDRDLLARTMNGQNHEQIASETGVSLGGLAMRLMRARRRLDKYLDDES